VIKSWGIGFPTVHVEADFLEPLEFGDVVRISVSVGRMGRSSVHMIYRARRISDGARIADARLTVACVDMKSFRACSIPDKLRAAFRQHLDEPPEAPPAGPAGGEVVVR
jgi:4-hydroxybenzoyl-CoA thioesterase